MNDEFTAHTLDNGLTVLLQENHSSPVISHWVWYRVGSRNDAPGKTGISHFVEHMQFKGSRRFPGQESFLSITRNGGIWNAFTGPDWTSYFETMPAGRIGTALELEADRMVNSVYDPDDVESERTVILSEKEGGLCEPFALLEETLQYAAFPQHPYGNPVIGESEDLCSLTRDDIYEHYRSRYAPNNAVVSIAGDFETEEMLRRVGAAYGNIPARPVPVEDIKPAEPILNPHYIIQPASRDLPWLRIVWHAPAAKDPAMPAFTLLNCILAGPCHMEALEGRFFPNETSRLCRKLENNGMRAGVSSWFLYTIDPYNYNLTLALDPGASVEEAADVVFGEIERVAREGVLPGEIEKARKQLKAVHAYAAEDVANQAYWLGQGAMFDDPDWFTAYPARLDRVGAEDIAWAAGSFLRRDNCVIGASVKKEEEA